MISFDTFTIAGIFAILGFGVFISFKILNITDLTVEASYTFGGAISIIFCKMHLPVLGLFLAFLGGALAGLITALLHTKLKINGVLAGILTLTAFYSINLAVTNYQPSIGILKPNEAYYFIYYQMNDVSKMFLTLAITILVGGLLILFFKTKLGLSIRACGDNDQMTEAQCINNDNMKILGLMLSNALVALAGGLFVQFQGSYSSDIGTGIMVIGVACIIIGEIFTFKNHNMSLCFLGIFIGSLIYRFIFAICLSIDTFKSANLKLVSALFLVLVLGGYKLYEYIRKKIQLKKVVTSNDQNK